MKKIINSRIGVLLLPLLFPLVASAAYDFEVDGIYYTISRNGNAMVSSGSRRYTGDVVIPEYVIYQDDYMTVIYPVTEIEKNAFSDCYRLSSIELPNTLQIIGENAFSGCSSLSSITFGDGITTIGADAFIGCEELAAVNISSIESWCNIDFYNLNSNPLNFAHNLYINGTLIENLEIPGSAIHIKQYAFVGGSCFKTLTIEHGVTEIEKRVFEGCTRIPSLTIPNSVNSIGDASFKGCLGIKDITLEDGSETLLCGNSHDNPMINIWTAGLFHDTSVEKAYVGRNIKFDECAPFAYIQTLKELTISNSVTVPAPFIDCVNLRELSLSESLKEFPTEAFENCISLTELVIPQSIELIGAYAFSGCEGLKKIVLSPSLKEIKYLAFENCKHLEALSVPGSVVAIGNDVFRNCTALREITFEQGDTTLLLGPGFFRDAKYVDPLEKLIIGRNIEYDKNYSDLPFENHPTLKEVVFTDNVTSIPHALFYGCSNLSSVTFGKALNEIGSNAFAGCTSLKEVHISDLSAWFKIKFSSGLSNPACSAYADLYYNGNKIEKLVIPDGIEAILPNVFAGCKGIKDIIIPSSVKTIGENAFYKTSITEIELPEYLESIGKFAFYETSLTEIELPKTLKSIGDYGFYYVPLTKIVSRNPVPPTITRNSFEYEVKKNATLHVTHNTKSAYRADQEWSWFNNIIEDIVNPDHIIVLDAIPDATYGDPEIDLSQYAPEGVELTYSIPSWTYNPGVEINGTKMRIIHSCGVDIIAELTDANPPYLTLENPERRFYVNKADLSVTVADITITQGQPLPAFTYVVDGFVYDDTIDDIQRLPQPICSVTEDSAPGEYTVTFNDGYDMNYNFITTTAKVTVVAPSSVELSALPEVKYGDTALDLTDFAPKGFSFEYESSDNDVVEINGSTMRIIGAGTASVTARFAEPNSETKIENAVRQIVVNKADLSVTVADITIAQGQPLPEFSYIFSGFVNGDTEDDIETMPQPVCDVTENSAPGEYVVTFTEGSDRNYNITTKPAKVTVLAAEPPISGIDEIDGEGDYEVEIFDMKGICLYRGMRSDARLPKGFYLVRRGTSVTKIYVE